MTRLARFTSVVAALACVLLAHVGHAAPPTVAVPARDRPRHAVPTHAANVHRVRTTNFLAAACGGRTYAFNNRKVAASVAWAAAAPDERLVRSLLSPKWAVELTPGTTLYVRGSANGGTVWEVALSPSPSAPSLWVPRIAMD